nr:immunoglobulin superfamily member 1-like isoform X2 [Chrysemys picta bellii]
MASALTVLLLGEYRRQPGCVPIRWDLRPGRVSIRWDLRPGLVSMGGMWDQGVGSRCSGIWSLTPISFSGCSLAGHSWVLGGQEFPKPTIWVSPSRAVALGGNVTIRCAGLYPGMEFFLRKAGDPNPQVRTVPDGTVAEFPIANVSREDRGSYTCDYHSIVEQNRTSHPSDSIEVIVGEPSYPKPSIYLRPSRALSLGGVVTVWCRGQHRGVRFVLNKERHHFPPVDSDDNEAVFPISNVRREDGRSYSCSYHSRSEPFNVSYPSDPVELVVRDPSLPRPSISLSPTGVTAPGADVTIRCQGQRRDVTFFLHKAGDLNPPRQMDPAEAGAEFLIPTVGRQHGGNYRCSYRLQSEPFVSSQPSDPVQLVVAGEGPGLTSPLPAPSPARPSWGLHADGMLRARLCPELWAQQRDARLRSGDGTGDRYNMELLPRDAGLVSGAGGCSGLAQCWGHSA